jgi:hypothetical protein
MCSCSAKITCGNCFGKRQFARQPNCHHKKFAADYKKKTKIEATIFVSRPAAGATVIKA